MAGINIYDLFRRMEEDDVILSFKGEITEDLLASVYRIMETRLEHEDGHVRRKKKFYHILVECLQNVYHHMVSLKDENGQGQAEKTAIFLIARGENGSYLIISGNFIRNEIIDELKKKLDHINSLSEEELRQFYINQLDKSVLSEKGTAGLGFIDMARKSGEKLEYSFHPVSKTLSFFSLTVTVH